MSERASERRTRSRLERMDFGRSLEAENEREDLERWRGASDAERSRVIVELMAYAETVAAATGVRNDAPAPSLPAPRRRLHDDAG